MTSMITEFTTPITEHAVDYTCIKTLKGTLHYTIVRNDMRIKNICLRSFNITTGRDEAP